ncbi:hypothetical protein [Microtetraspora malaysiensis]|uniref:DUF2637 domain-containing protein n=1 Tax=Microtetraspora malaysiensis TaxID=161358 RepID=A0ABW6SKL9_9ACTN
MNEYEPLAGSPDLPWVEQVVDLVAEHPIAAAIIGVVALVLLVLAYFVIRTAYRKLVRRVGPWVSRQTPEDLLTMTVATIATGVSAHGMWQFSEDMLGMSGPLRLVLFAFIELAIITSAVRAKRSMRENYSAGIDGVAVWGFASLTAILSAMDAILSGDGIRGLAAAIFRLVAPLVAAWLWDRGMALERRRRTGLKGIHWRITPERVLVRLGLAEATDRTAGDVDAQRRITRLALAAVKVRDLREAGASDRKLRKAVAILRKAMNRAVEHAALAENPARQKSMLDQIGALYDAAGLVELPHVAPWKALDHPAIRGRVDELRVGELTAELQRWTAVHQEEKKREANGREPDRENLATILSLAAYVTGHHVTPVARDVTPHVTPGVIGDVTSPPVTPPVTSDVTPPPDRDVTSRPVTPEITPQATSGVTPTHQEVTPTRPGTAPAPRGEAGATPAGPLGVTGPAAGGRVTGNVITPQVKSTKTSVMRALWERRRKTQDFPTVTELADEAGADHAQASRLRKDWVEELPPEERVLAMAKPKSRTTA